MTPPAWYQRQLYQTCQAIHARSAQQFALNACTRYLTITKMKVLPSKTCLSRLVGPRVLPWLGGAFKENPPST